MGTTALKEELITYNSQEKGHTIPHRATWGSTRVSEEEKAATGQDGPGFFFYGPESLLWFQGEEMGQTA